ncbi:MAG TPA: hypothetical protein VEL75_00360 [Candidatus Methylomirabilis sp.]|nr:hypothetical protein [Candidatus Methylomirabilis sp.]
MNSHARRFLVGAVVLMIGLGLLEMATTRVFIDRISKAAESQVDEGSGSWQDMLNSQGELLSLEVGPPAGSPVQPRAAEPQLADARGR